MEIKNKKHTYQFSFWSTNSKDEKEDNFVW